MPTTQVNGTRDRRIVALILDGQLSITRIGELNGITRERVRQIGNNAGVRRTKMSCAECGEVPRSYRHNKKTGDHKFVRINR